MSNSVNLSLDVTKTGIQNPLIKVRQGDGGFETLRTTVTANGEPMDLQGWTITFMGTTAGNHKIVDGNVTLVEAPNGIFDYTPSKAWGMDIGDFKIAYFKFVKGDGSASSANFRVSVIEAVDMTQEEAQNYISVVDATIAEINKNVNSLGNRVDEYNNKLAAIKVGGRNLLLDTGRSFTGIGTNSVNGTFNDQGGQYYLAGGRKVSDLYNQYGPSEYLTLSFDWTASGSVISGEFLPQWNNTPWGGLSDAGNIKIGSANTSGHYVNTVSFNKDGYSSGNATGIRFRQDNLQGNVTISNVKLEAGNVSTDWSPAPEDMVAKSENAYFKNARILPADARDFAIIASDTIKYQGIWYTDGNVIANGPTSNWSWSTIEVLGGFGSGAGVIRTAAFPNSQEYITTVNSGKIVGWKKVTDDTNVAHKTGTETIAGDKTFTGKVTADNLVSNSVPVNVTKTTTFNSWFSSTTTVSRSGNTVTIVNNKPNTGIITNTTTSVEAIPVGYRPSVTLSYPAMFGSSIKGELQINKNGTFTALSNINDQYRVTATYVTSDTWPV